MSRGKGAHLTRMDEILANLAETGSRPRLLLHSCCGPCSTAVIETLARRFEITVHYHNPNIDTREEYERRASAQRDALGLLGQQGPIGYIEEAYLPEEFLERAAPFACEPEGGLRCGVCISLRLEKTARRAAEGGFPWFCSTLTVSPHKDADLVNSIGSTLAGLHPPLAWLPSDFKKRDGYRRSIALSAQFGLYRQDYCGCPWSARGREE